MRYFIRLGYSGKNYCGWQKQPNAPSVQAEIETKLSTLLRQETEIVGCGRTDTGVHAKEYFAHFEIDQKLDGPVVCFKLNAMLAKDIVIYEVFLVEPNLHARFDAKLREYEYWISTLPDPFLHELSYLYPRPLNIEAMNEAAALIMSHTDFECFSKVHTDVKTFNCKITHANWQVMPNNKLLFTIRADRFLRNMVRAIVGTLLEVGKGKLTLAQVEAILLSKNRSEAGQSMPAHGLYLSKISYESKFV